MNGDFDDPGEPTEVGPNRQRLTLQWWVLPRNWTRFPLDSSYGKLRPLRVTYAELLTLNVDPDANTAKPWFAASTEIPAAAVPFFPETVKLPEYVPFANTILWPGWAFDSAEDSCDEDDTLTTDVPSGIGAYGVPSG